MWRTKEVAYRNSMRQRDMCAAKSRQALQSNDLYMFRFWSNASRAFEARAVDVCFAEREDRLFAQIREVKSGIPE